MLEKLKSKTKLGNQDGRINTPIKHRHLFIYLSNIFHHPASCFPDIATLVADHGLVTELQAVVRDEHVVVVRSGTEDSNPRGPRRTLGLWRWPVEITKIDRH